MGNTTSRILSLILVGFLYITRVFSTKKKKQPLNPCPLSGGHKKDVLLMSFFEFGPPLSLLPPDGSVGGREFRKGRINFIRAQHLE